MAAVTGHELILDRGEGVWLWDEAGRPYLDATASLWYANVGYGRRRIANAVAEQLERLHAYQTHGDLATRPALELADTLAQLSPLEDAKVFLTSGGSDGIETAVKLVRRYHAEVGSPQRTVLLTRAFSYHGLHGFGTSLTGIDGHREGHGPLLDDTARVPWDDLGELERTIDRVGASRVAGLFIEPVIGTGGVRIAPPGYLRDAAKLIHDAGGLVVADEVVTGFGRVGHWFASSRLDLDADVFVVAKGVTSGYAPLGAVIASAQVATPFWQPGVAWRHGYTYSGHAAGAAAALENLAILREERLLERARTLESELGTALEPLLELANVTEIRSGTGVMAAIQLHHPDDPRVIAEAVSAARAHGVLTRALTGGALQISPPLVITDDEVGQLVARIHDALAGAPASA
jgi:putrescine---pyruvate transaminase